MTIQLTLWGAIGALVIGTVSRSCRVSPVRVLQKFGAGYVTVAPQHPADPDHRVLLVRASPTPCGSRWRPRTRRRSSWTTASGWPWSGWPSTTRRSSAEALRSGINTVPVGQAEAARSIGLTFAQHLAHIVLPQAFRGRDRAAGQHPDRADQEHHRRRDRRGGGGGLPDAEHDRVQPVAALLGVRDHRHRLRRCSPCRSACCSPGCPTGWRCSDERAGRPVRRPGPARPACVTGRWPSAPG